MVEGREAVSKRMNKMTAKLQLKYDSQNYHLNELAGRY